MDCPHNNIFVMDYVKHIDNDGDLIFFGNESMPKVKIINRVCSRCHYHWFGLEDNVIGYTSREWDKYLNDTK